MPEFKITYKGPFSNHTEIIDADDLEDAKYIANLKSVYTYFTVEEFFDEEEEDSPA